MSIFGTKFDWFNIYFDIYMRKNIFIFLIIMLLCANGVMAQFNGSGTESDPYLISTQQDLKNLIKSVNNSRNDFSGKFFKQTDDIDFVDSQVFPDGFTPIGDYDRNRPFSGIYDGDGHTISKLYITGNDNAAMFGYVENGCIKNLNFENVNVSAYSTGIFSIVAAQAINSTISRITVNGQLASTGSSDNAKLTGIVGVATRCTISECVSMLTVDISDGNAAYRIIAGIATADSRTTVTNCLVSTYINGLHNYSEYYPIVDKGLVSNCLVTESNVLRMVATENVTYRGCYFDQQNTPYIVRLLNIHYSRNTLMVLLLSRLLRLHLDYCLTMKTGWKHLDCIHVLHR